MVDGRYKYIYTPDRPLDRALLESERFFDGVCAGQAACASVPREELYDLTSDPFEQNDLLKGTPSREAAEALERMRGQLTAHMNEPPAYRHRLLVGDSSSDQVDEATREALRALGYIK